MKFANNILSYFTHPRFLQVLKYLAQYKKRCGAQLKKNNNELVKQNKIHERVKIQHTLGYWFMY